jgi:prepilin-type N-terminal cleavage/methylation domain-containing protein
VKDRRGFTLVEMLIVVVLLGTLTLMAVPRIERALAYRDVDGARSSLSALYQRAKLAAVQHRRPATLTMTASDAWATVTTPSGTTSLGRVALRSEFGVAATFSSGSLVIQPTGLVLAGTPFVVRLAKSGLLDSVMITGYGRLE